MSQQLKEVAQARKLKESRNFQLEQFIEKWDRTEVGAELRGLSPQKQKVTAVALERQMKEFKRIKESGTQISSAFGTSPENVLRIIRIGVANSNRPDIFTEWPLTSTNDALYYVDRVYGTTLRGATAGQRIYDIGAPAADYASAFNTLSTTPALGDGATLTFTGTFSPVPIKPYSVTVVVNQVGVGNDNGSGTLSGSYTLTGTTTGTIDYATGIYSVTFTIAPALGVPVQLQAVWDSENSANYAEEGDMQLRVTKLPFRLYQHPLYYSYSKFSELVFETTGLGDFEEQVVKGLGDEHAKRRDYKSFQLARRVAGSNPTVTFNADFAAAGEDNDFNHAQRIATTINDISATIFDDVKRGEVTKIIGTGKGVNYLKKHTQWKSDNSQPKVGGSYLAGKFYDIDVYVTPAHVSTVNSTSTTAEMLCVFKNPQEEGEPSIAFGVLTELAASLDYPELYRKGVLASIEGELTVQPKFIRNLLITGLT